ncbi:MAG TPA: hypothetical protein VMM76_23355, partial [Pirellulaceae bacterium]|nr:hypothetical protein [Pirellulaceae bacterium]
MASNDPLFDDLEPLTDDLEPLTEEFDPLSAETPVEASDADPLGLGNLDLGNLASSDVDPVGIEAVPAAA